MNTQTIQPQGPLFWIIAAELFAAGLILTWIVLYFCGPGVGAVAGFLVFVAVCCAPIFHQWLVLKALQGVK